MKNPAHDLRNVAELGAAWAHQRKLNAFVLDRHTINVGGGDQWTVAGTLKLYRDGEIRMQIAERAERSENDAFACHFNIRSTLGFAGSAQSTKVYFFFACFADFFFATYFTAFRAVPSAFKGMHTYYAR
jgi:hypothetical protein